MYITATSTISHQPTFRNKGFSAMLSALEPSSEILHPDYTSFIPARTRRRMTDGLKMAAVCAKDCLAQIGLEQPDAIAVGTSMGCSLFTKKFLKKIVSFEGGLLSPTSFMLSTHNTIAGQISLLLGNHQYNMTHTQNTLSFEHALLDGMMHIEEGQNNVLVGAADEREEELYNIKERLHNQDVILTCGASFFILSSHASKTNPIKLVDVKSLGLVENVKLKVLQLLKANDWLAKDIDLILYASSHQTTKKELSELFEVGQLFDYQRVSGLYFTNSAFALNYATDILSRGKHPVEAKSVKKILICNNIIPENLGLMLLEHC